MALAPIPPAPGAWRSTTLPTKATQRPAKARRWRTPHKATPGFVVAHRSPNAIDHARSDSDEDGFEDEEESGLYANVHEGDGAEDETRSPNKDREGRIATDNDGTDKTASKDKNGDADSRKCDASSASMQKSTSPGPATFPKRKRKGKSARQKFTRIKQNPYRRVYTVEKLLGHRRDDDGVLRAIP